jgi:dihydropteroate synthase type 2
MIGVSRKSFLKTMVNRATSELGAASLAAELFAALQGADIIRTHETKPLKDALAIFAGLKR